MMETEFIALSKVLCMTILIMNLIYELRENIMPKGGYKVRCKILKTTPGLGLLLEEEQ